jgi:uncharacterized membrane protein YheB (UPF0754 family)
MKKMKIRLIVFIILIGFKSNSQEKFFNSACDCINQIEEKSNQAIIADKIQTCVQRSFQNHNSDIGKILQNYVNANPQKDMRYAEQNLSKIITEKLIQRCPEFKEINQKLSEQQENSSDVLNTIANEICTELKDKSNLTDKIVDPIIIAITKRHQVSVYGQYNLDDRSEMKRFGTELTAELIKECADYKKFVEMKNAQK